MPYAWNFPRVPDLAKLHTAGHRRAVKCLYRRTLKFAKVTVCQLNYTKFDWHALNIRKEFEKSMQWEDAGEVNRCMKELEQALNECDDDDMYVKPWDGPRGHAYNRYPMSPLQRFQHREADGKHYFDEAWKEETTEEWYTKQEIEKFRARYIIIMRDATMHCGDYPQWLAMKKRLEEELKFRIEDIMSTMHKTWKEWLYDWPYNAPEEFSDGWKPDWRLDIALQDHWDEELWRKVAELEAPEQEALEKYGWNEQSSRRTHDKLLER
mmetsp:Transcript_33460/g.54464  ORF Transcript_33460/g.54464 Transcript_33460/m.54464 type:complete len:266 (+) Transcript_33460:37-834(+)